MALFMLASGPASIEQQQSSSDSCILGTDIQVANTEEFLMQFLMRVKYIKEIHVL